MKFIDKIAQGFSYDESKVVGYSEEELKKIEDFYLIKIAGDLRDFMLEMGRCSGGLIRTGNLNFYDKHATIRNHLLLQEFVKDELGKIKEHEYLGGIFVFAMEDEDTIYYFLRTKAESYIKTYVGEKTLSNDPNIVYCYDENEEKVCDTGLTFIEYLKKEVLLTQKEYKESEIWQGELIVI